DPVASQTESADAAWPEEQSPPQSTVKEHEDPVPAFGWRVRRGHVADLERRVMTSVRAASANDRRSRRRRGPLTLDTTASTQKLTRRSPGRCNSVVLHRTMTHER